MTDFDVIGFGALNVDKLFKVDRIAAEEEESFVKDFTEACGGSAANTAVGLARLGCKVGFVGKAARDPEGHVLLEDFRKEGVDTHGIIIAKTGRSGKVMGFVDEEGDRALYVDTGVNGTIEYSEIDNGYLSNTKFLHLTSFVGEKSFQTQKKTLETLSNVKISLDPGAVYARLGLVKLEPIIDKTFAMMPNSRELALITGKENYREGAKFLLQKGVRIVAVKLGSKGCYVTDGTESQLIEPFRVEVVDTTGAGDAFNAGFLFGLLSRRSLSES
jgi:sugar/nucleoside kinase (ribokinase family)